MKRIFWALAMLLGVLLALGSHQLAIAIAPQPTEPPTSQPALVISAAINDTDAQTSSFAQAIAGMERLDGLFTLYRDRDQGRLYAEITPQALNVYHLCTATLESGLGQGWLLGGLDIIDFPFMFRKVNNRLQFVIPNVYFRANPGDPLRRVVQRSFSSSVLQSLEIKAIHPSRQSYLVDLGPLFLKDLSGLTQDLRPAYQVNEEKTYFRQAQNFPTNTELEAVYGLTGSGDASDLPYFVEAIPDSRSFNLSVRYSLSRLPMHNGYRPRQADNRVGYFVTAYQNFSDPKPRQPFVRYINRWHLVKQDPTAPLSPPQEPIVFWIENTVPPEYRAAVRDGILMWNRAFEKIGFQDAIQAKQMPDDATWDPADIRYNTIRWLGTFGGGLLGVGPSRVNPLTGQILDADVLINASFARYAQQEYEAYVQDAMRQMPALARLTGNPRICGYGLDGYSVQQATKQLSPPQVPLTQWGQYDLCYGLQARRQLAIGALSLSMLHNALPSSATMEDYVQDFLRTLVAHEVGHALGLRHNFRASAMLAPEELNDTRLTHERGLVASVMDYNGVNLAPEGTPQGDFFTQVVGPYDEWAIAYGYAVADPRDPLAERELLGAIASRAPEPDLAYATDEDTFSGLDPLVNMYDMSGDLLTYAPWQLDNAQRMWEKLERRYRGISQDSDEVRQIFDEILHYYFQYSIVLTNYIGGQTLNRYGAATAPDRRPFEPIPLAQQKQALELLQSYVFDDTRFQFSPSLLNSLPPSRWSHWGQFPRIFNLDYPIYDRIQFLQAVMLYELLDNSRLRRLQNLEFKAPPDQVLTIADLFQSLQASIWQPILEPDRPMQLTSLRRGLQRQHLTILTQILQGEWPAPPDAQSLARYQLRQLHQAVDRTLDRRSRGMDVATRAHLEDVRDRLREAL